MAITASTALSFLAFGHRRRFGDPHPEGLAVGHLTLTGDASGGDVTAVFTAPSHFLYRLEAVTHNRGDTSPQQANILFVHRMLEDAAAFGSASLNLDYALGASIGITFTSYVMGIMDFQSQRRLPLGRLDPAAPDPIIQMINALNSNTITYDFDVFLAYWGQEAMYLPGFLQAFWEAPILESTIERALRA